MKPAARPRLLVYSDLPAKGCAAHTAETRYRRGERVSEHVHDFAEVFFITDGMGYEARGGRRQRLDRGDVRIVRPDDAHSLGTDTTMFIVNVAFPAFHLRRLVGQFPPEGGYRWSVARGARVDAATLAEIGLEFRRFVARPASGVRLSRFLITIVDAIETKTTPTAVGSDTSEGASPPKWLISRLEDLAVDPELLQEGLPALVRLTDRSADHIGRVCRSTIGTTATGLINRIRLDRAARLLSSPTRDIAAIAFDAGFSNLSYFYRRFRERFGTSPRRYREAAQRTIRG